MNTGARALAENKTAIAVGLIVLATCMAAVYATPRDSYWLVDCGNKALFAERLLETRFGDLNFDYPASVVDPTGEEFPMRGPFAHARGDGFVSSYSPAYPALSVPFLSLLGRPGLRVPAALGVAASALLFVVWLTPVVGRVWAALGGLGLGLATPLFFYGTTVWEHSVTVALTLGVWVVLSRPSTGRLIYAGLLSGMACWFREELILVWMTLAFTCYLRGYRPSMLLPLLAGLVLPIGALAVFNFLAFGTPLGSHLATNIGPGTSILALVGLGLVVGAMAALRGRRPSPNAIRIVVFGLAALMAASMFALGDRALSFGRDAVGLLGATGHSSSEALSLGLLTVGAFAIGFGAAHNARAVVPATWIVLCIGLGVWGFGFARIHQAAPNLLLGLVSYNGLMVHMPAFCAAGLGTAVVWRFEEYESLRNGIAAGMLFMILATGLSVVLGMTTSVHWGPRLLLPGVPAIVAVVIVAARYTLGLASRGTDDHSSTTAPIRAMRFAWVALALAGLLSSAHGTWFLFQQKSESQRLQETILSLPQPFLVTEFPLLGQHLSALWHQKPILRTQEERFPDVARRLREYGANGFIYVVPVQTPIRKGILGTSCRLESEHRGRHLSYLNVDVQVCTFN